MDSLLSFWYLVCPFGTVSKQGRLLVPPPETSAEFVAKQAASAE
jgi:hypothetical protein